MDTAVQMWKTSYGASERCIAANVNPKLPPESVTFAVLPNMGYFEFIPLKHNLDGLELKCIGKLQCCMDHNKKYIFNILTLFSVTEVKVVDEYEIIVTNFAGLYGYRLGDVVKVKGFHNSTPELQFICRRNLLLCVNVDNHTEKDLQLSVEAAAKILADSKLEVLDFTSHANTSTDPGSYVIFWEVSGEASDEVLKECCNCLDCSFLDEYYLSSWKVNSIRPLELRLLRRGTFDKILEHYVSLGAASQFKTPRCVGANNTAVLTILCNNVVKTQDLLLKYYY